MDKSRLNILVVDDERYILEVITDFLEGHGYERIISFLDSQQAKEYLKDHGNIDVLITDLQMPKVSGQELVRIAQQKSVRKIIVISGSFGFNGPTKEEICKMGAIPIEKPFKPEQVAAEIEYGGVALGQEH